MCYVEYITLSDKSLQNYANFSLNFFALPFTHKYTIAHITKYDITKIGITDGYPSGYAAMIENNEWAKEHKKYNVMLERKLRMNFRTGYWEIAFYHTKPLSCVPKDMRMC